MAFSWLGQARSAILRISRGILRGAARLWRDFSGPWWGPHPLITTDQKPEISTRGENLGAVNLQMETLVGSVYDAGAGLVGPIGDPVTPWQPAAMYEYEFTWEGTRPLGDPFYRQLRMKAPLGSTYDDLKDIAERELDELRGNYPGIRIMLVSTFILQYGA